MAVTSAEFHDTFVSYGWDPPEQKRAVLSFVNFLTHNGVDAWIDQFADPTDPWPIWCYKQILHAKHVLIVCTEEYEQRLLNEEPNTGAGRGQRWEGFIITEAVYNKVNERRKYIPITFREEDKAFRPFFLPGSSIYNVSDTEQLLDVYAKLTGQVRVEAEHLGKQFKVPPIAAGTWNVQLPDVEPTPAGANAGSLEKVVEGTWFVDTRHPVMGTQTFRLTLKRKIFGKRVFEAEVVVGPPGWRASGEWDVLPPGNRLAVHGLQQMPYGFDQLNDSYEFSSITPKQMQATSAHNVPVTWRRA